MKSIRNRLAIILLKKLDRILNPKFENKFIYALFTTGSALLLYQRCIQLVAKVEIITESWKAKLSLSSSVDITFTIIGSLLILISVYVFIALRPKTNSKPQTYRNLKKAAAPILKLMNDNKRVFENFGPNSGAGTVGPYRNYLEVWEEQKTTRIIPNNRKIEKILTHIKELSETESIEISKMLNHIAAFEKHCEEPTFDYSETQFPQSFSHLITQYRPPRKQVHKPRTIKHIEWIDNKLSSSDIEFGARILFGSSLVTNEGNDVDVLIRTKTNQREDIQNQAKFWMELKSDFRKAFSKNLHLTVFSELESDHFDKFLNKIPEPYREF